MKLRIKLLLLAILSSTYTLINAQTPVANFTSDKTQGCPPSLVIQFTADSSSYIKTFNWDFGNGNTSTLRNPSAIYVNPGIYTVKLTVSDGTNSNSQSKSIRVFNPPTADFKATPTKGCIPFTASFSDLSTKGDGNINGWKWDFRDGSTRTTQFTTYTYNVQKKHAVYLKVTDANGCYAELEKTDYIDVAEKPNVSFTANPSNSCKIPQVVNFTNTSTGLGTLLYEWTFGNGKTSTVKDASTTYDAYGTYNVKLKVTSNDYVCDNSFEYPAVKLTQIKAMGLLTLDDTVTINNNDTICAGTIAFTNQSIGSTIAYWDFGDGTPTSTFPSGSHTFNNAGTFIVKLIASPGNQCADTLKWKITIEKPVANFSFISNTGCVSPLSITFNSTSTGANSYVWEFHNGTTKTGASANFTYYITPKSDSTEINSPIDYPVILKAYSASGCVSTITKNYTIDLPTAIFSVDTTQGCLPLTINFTDHSLTSSSIVSRKWEFGDNTSQTSGTTAKKIYSTAGTYESRLIVTDSKGCSDTSFFTGINVGKTPNPDFQVTTPHTFYSDELVNFQDLTPAGDNINYWNYLVNGASVSAPNYNIPNLITYVNSDTGYFDVTLIVGNYGCFNQKTYPKLIRCLGPISNFEYTTDCSNPYTYQFTGKIKGFTSFIWDFGDGNTNIVSQTPQHTYAAEGNYTVKLKVFNNSHVQTFTNVVYVREPKAQITSLPGICIHNGLYLNALNSFKITNLEKNRCTWNFEDNTKDTVMSADSVYHEYNKRGIFKVRLIAKYANGCVDTAYKNIQIYSPYAKITADTASGCDHLSVKLKDSSTKDKATLNKWEWNFGDGMDSTVNSAGIQINHQFDLPSNYTSWEYPVTLKVTDIDGCIGTDTSIIRISKPSAQFSEYSSLNLCSTDSFKVSRNFINPDSVIWYFGDGTTSKNIAKKVAHLYKNAGDYRVALKVYKYYCTDSVIKPVGYLKIQKADAHYIVSDSILNCPDSIQFTHDAIMSPVDSGKWIFGTGDFGPYNVKSEYTYPHRGEFLSQLRVYTSFGCADTFSKLIKIYGPYADFGITPKMACKGDTIKFELRDTVNIKSWVWDIGDGNLYNNINNIKHIYNTVGTKLVQLKFSGIDSTCKLVPTQHNVYIEEVISNIGIADTSVCENESVNLSNLSVGNTGFKWELGDVNTSNVNNPTQTYSPGIYTIKLMVDNSTNGCKDTAEQKIHVNPKPVITLTPDTVICEGGTLMLKASGGNMYFWTPADSLSATNIPNPVSNIDSSITYVVHVTIDSTGCSETDSVHLKVQNKINFDLEPHRDTTMFVGDEITIRVVNPKDNYLYNWNPQTGLICHAECSEVTVKPEGAIAYTLITTDLFNCFTRKDTLKITIKDTCIFDVAKAFTPNGAEANRILQVKGKGIKELVEFKIYNRWGNLVFQSSDISKGWDGTYQGKEQPVDTYIYTISVRTYKDFILSKKGSVLLIR